MYTFIATVPFSCVVYWMVGFRNDPDAFFLFALVVGALSITLNSFGHLIVALMPNAAVAGIFGGLFISLFSLFAGFYITEPAIPKGWIWFYWANPVSHALRGTWCAHLSPSATPHCTHTRTGAL